MKCTNFEPYESPRLKHDTKWRRVCGFCELAHTRIPKQFSFKPRVCIVCFKVPTQFICRTCKLSIRPLCFFKLFSQLSCFLATLRTILWWNGRSRRPLQSGHTAHTTQCLFHLTLCPVLVWWFGTCGRNVEDAAREDQMARCQLRHGK